MIQVITIVCILVMSGSVYADAVDDAYWICDTMEKGGFSTECKVNVRIWDYSTVDVWINTNSTEARIICLGVADIMAQKKRNFLGRWNLESFPHIVVNILLRCVRYSRIEI